MKNSVLLAAGALLGSATAGVHKAKLQKVPLHEQLVSYILFNETLTATDIHQGTIQHRRPCSGSRPEVHGC